MTQVSPVTLAADEQAIERAQQRYQRFRIVCEIRGRLLASGDFSATNLPQYLNHPISALHSVEGLTKAGGWERISF